MIDFEITEFIDSSKIDKNYISDLIEAAEKSDHKQNVRDIANKTLSLLAPSVSESVYFSSIKTYASIGATEEEARNGFHVFRSYFAHRINRINRKLNPANQVSEIYDRDGIVVLEDFLNEKIRDRIVEEIKKFPIAVSKNQNNLIMNSPSDSILAFFIKDSQMRNIILNCLAFDDSNDEAKRLYVQNTFVQKLHNRGNDGDVQKVLHSDTFFPCIKWWYFPEKVDIEDGPFAYAPGSNKFTKNIAKFLYEQSILITQNKIDPKRTYGHAEGSIRIFEHELGELGLEEKKYSVPANTLVIGNVHGFHRRSEVTNEAFRNSIHGSIRVDTPFYA